MGGIRNFPQFLDLRIDFLEIFLVFALAEIFLLVLFHVICEVFLLRYTALRDVKIFC